jgi:hypothetical protein
LKIAGQKTGGTMGKIGEIVQGAIDLMERGLNEKAFMQACLACRETIKKAHHKDDLTLPDYKNFVDEHWDLLNFMSFPAIKSPFLEVQFVIKEISMNPRRDYTIKEIVVFLLTYGLRNQKLPNDMTFFTGNDFEKNNERLFIPNSLIRGLLELVVVHPINKDETIPDKYWLSISDFKMFISELWGRIDLAERVRRFYLTR